MPFFYVCSDPKTPQTAWSVCLFQNYALLVSSRHAFIGLKSVAVQQCRRGHFDQKMDVKEYQLNTADFYLADRPSYKILSHASCVFPVKTLEEVRSQTQESVYIHET